MRLCIILAAAAAHKSKKPNWIIATPSMRPEMWDVNDANKYCAAAAPPANFSRRPQFAARQTFEIGRLGLDVAGAAAHMRSSVGPGAAFECRLDRTSREGPRRAPCEVIPRIGGAYDNGTAPFYYDIVIPNPIDAGTYDLRVLWMHASAKEASAPSTKPLCRVLRAGGDERLGKVKVPKERTVSRPCAGLASSGIRAHEGAWRAREWRPRCAWQIYDRHQTETCFQSKQPLFVGDSHTRLMFDTLTDQPADLQSTGDVVFMAAEDPTSELKVDARNRKVVVANWGHWRLRDGDVETYVKDWQKTIRALSNNLPPSTTLIWRTMPAYSYRREELDKRTNAKIREATARQLEFLEKELPHVVVHDTFSITTPRLFDANNKHHYLGFARFVARNASLHDSQFSGDVCGGGVGPRRVCPWLMRERRGSTYAVGNAVGLADLNALLNLLCND
jgi:hypothetical protein